MWLTPSSEPRRRKLTASMPPASRMAKAASTISSRPSFLGRPRLSVDVVVLIVLLLQCKSYSGQEGSAYMLTETSRPIAPEDDSWRFHERPADPFWNESGLFGFMIPER